MAYIADSSGEYESMFLTDSRIYLCWQVLSYDLSQIESKQAIEGILVVIYLDLKITNDYQLDGKNMIADISVIKPGYRWHSIRKHLQQPKLHEQLASMIEDQWS